MSEQRFERGAVITDVDHGRGVLTAEMPSGPITFQRPDPTEFVLLVARVGPGTGNADPKLAHKFGAQSFKPTGTEYATEKDMRDAGYWSGHEIRRQLQPIHDALAVADTCFDDDSYQNALDRLRALLSECFT